MRIIARTSSSFESHYPVTEERDNAGLPERTCSRKHAATVAAVRGALEGQWRGLDLRTAFDSSEALVRRLAGASPRTLGIDGTRRAVSDVRRVVRQIDETKNGLYRAVAKELREAGYLTALVPVELGGLGQRVERPRCPRCQQDVKCHAQLGLGELVELPEDEPGHVYHLFVVRTDQRDSWLRAIAKIHPSCSSCVAPRKLRRRWMRR